MITFTDNDWNHFHDVVVDTTGDSIPEMELEQLFFQLPNHLKDLALEWGMCDTVWRDDVSEWLTQNPGFN